MVLRAIHPIFNHMYYCIIAARRWCRKTRLGASQPWEYEVGENPDEGANVNRDMIVISSSMVCPSETDVP